MSATKADFEEDKRYSLWKAVFIGKSQIQLQIEIIYLLSENYN